LPRLFFLFKLLLPQLFLLFSQPGFLCLLPHSVCFLLFQQLLKLFLSLFLSLELPSLPFILLVFSKSFHFSLVSFFGFQLSQTSFLFSNLSGPLFSFFLPPYQFFFLLSLLFKLP